MPFRNCFPASNLGTRNFSFRQSKLSFYTQSVSFRNSKFGVCKLEISSFETQNFEFPNAKFRFREFEAGKLITKRHFPYGPPWLTAINTCLDEMEEFKGRDIAVSK